MKLFGYEIRKVLPEREEIKKDYLDGAEYNAIRGIIQGELELKHHTILLEEAPDLNRTEQEIKGYKEAIERDNKTINNWQSQLRAIEYERKN
jgi:hypothetical protein